MSIVKKIFVLLPLLFNYSFAQFYQDSVISNYVTEFMKIADETAMTTDSTGKIHKEFEDNEIRHIAELYFKAKDKDPVGFNRYIQEAYYRWEESVRINEKVSKLKPATKRHLLVKKIAEKYGISFAEVIGTPAFLRGKYLQLTCSKYHSTDSQRSATFRVSNFVFVIEEVLKGNKYFKIGDTISVMMIPNIESPGPEFEVGNSYLIPVRTNLGMRGGEFNIVFNHLHDAYDVWKMGEPPKTFPIEDEVIKDCEYLGIKDTDWVDFKKYFNKTYLIFD